MPKSNAKTEAAAIQLSMRHADWLLALRSSLSHYGDWIVD